MSTARVPKRQIETLATRVPLGIIIMRASHSVRPARSLHRHTVEDKTLSALPEELNTPAIVRRLLADRGLPEHVADAKAALLERCAAALARAGVRDMSRVRALVVPGRIEVLGKHTDYAGGRSVLAATERGFCLVVAPRHDAVVRMIDVGWHQEAEFEIRPDLVPGHGWSAYPMTVARRIARNFTGPLCGADIAFVSDLPADSGMSSSSALITATFLALASSNRLAERSGYRENIPSTERLGEYLGMCENGQSFGPFAGDKGVGTFGGSEDHTAILCCKPRTLSVYSFCPVRPEQTLPMPEGMIFAVGFSGVTASKTGAAMHKYNRVSLLAAAACEQWRLATGRNDRHLAAVLGALPDAPAQLRAVLGGACTPDFTSDDLIRRCEQFIAENEEIIPAAVRALAAGDLEAFGRQVDRSQQLAESHLGNQVPETIFLARSARSLAAVAASAFGAGFGGSVWAMVRKDSAEDFLHDWCELYRSEYPGAAERAVFLLTGAGPGAFFVGPT